MFVERFDVFEIDENSISKFDYVLVDVFCFGFGIIRCKLEIKYKKEEELKDIIFI